MNLVKKVSNIIDGVQSQFSASLFQIIVLCPLIREKVVNSENCGSYDVRPMLMQPVDVVQPLAIDIGS